jgi:hypothetical protein
VGVDGFDGERLHVRVTGRSYAVGKVGRGLRWRSFWDVTRRGFHVSTPEPRRFSPVRDGFDEVIKPVPTSKVVDVVSGDVVFREGMHVRHGAFLYSPQHSQFVLAVFIVSTLTEVAHIRRVLFTLNSFHIVLMNILFTSKSNIGVKFALEVTSLKAYVESRPVASSAFRYD